MRRLPAGPPSVGEAELTRVRGTLAPMIPAAVPKDESRRLTALRDLGILDTPFEERFDRITRVAADLFGVPMVTLNLIDTHIVLVLVYLTFNLPIVVWICTDQFRGVPRDLDEAARLAGLRMDAEELRVEAEIRAGHARDVLEHARALVAQAPLRERRWALLATALHQAGRQAEAFAALKQARARLVDELGLRTCSMGMTDDLAVAVQEGSTRVRVGTALFGPRDPSADVLTS